MEDLKQKYLYEMKSMNNQIQIEDYRNERIDIHYKRECEIKIDELKVNFNGMSIEINKKKELWQQEQAANLKDSLIMGDEDLHTIPEKESDEFIKSSVGDLVPILNDDFTSSDDESLSDEDVPKDKVKIYSNPLFEFDDEYIFSDENPLFDEVLEDIENKDFYISNMDEPNLFVTTLSDSNEDECFDPGGDVDEINAFDIPSDFEDGYYDSKGDVLYLES
uniref:Reverse transcriptase domain-containing protein n=1 Tax=Tanacetum cinerariifolium TaxID=118510 RepID=A0A6L2K043_TANCI|nr:hypothetical protein [Tanacetum cinerariifolium]